MNIGVSCDVNNLFQEIAKKYPKRKLNYRALYGYVDDLGVIKYARAYGSQLRNEAAIFIECLKRIGYTPRYEYKNRNRDYNWSVDLAVDTISSLKDVDLTVICSNRRVLIPLLQYLKQQNKRIIILAANIPEIFSNYAECVEIPESMLEQHGRGVHPKIKGQPDALAYNE